MSLAAWSIRGSVAIFRDVDCDQKLARSSRADARNTEANQRKLWRRHKSR
jgi:hypothetical protein